MKTVNCNECVNLRYGSHSHYCLLGIKLRFVKTDLPGIKYDPGFRRRCEKYDPIKQDHLPEAGKMIETYPNIGMLRNAFEKETGKPCEVYWEGSIENPAYTSWLEDKLIMEKNQ